MNNGILIEGMSKDELMQHFITLGERIEKLEESIQINVQQDFRLDDLSRAKGYSIQQLRAIIKKRKIPYSYKNGRLVVTREIAQLIAPKKSRTSGRT